MKITKRKVLGLILLLFFCLETSALAQKKVLGPEDLGQLSGKILLDGKPFPYGFVAFFSAKDGGHQDFGGNSKRSPGMVAFIGEDGTFTTQPFPIGNYYIGAMMRKKWVGGPPRQGEKRYSAIDENGKYPIFTVKAGETIAIGDVTVKEPEDFPELTEFFTIEGKVLSEEGRGMFGAVVVAKKDLNDPKGLYISEETGMDGSYTLKIPPGKYFFVARNALTRAGRPKPGGLMGTLGHNKPVGLGGKSDEPPAFITGEAGGEFKDVNITMFKVPIPDVRRKEVEAEVKANKIDKSSLPDNLPLMKQPASPGEETQYKAQ